MTKNPETRGTRDGVSGRPPASLSIAENSAAETYPEPSEVIVSGRSPTIVWRRENRNDFNALVALAAKFNLFAQELVPNDFARKPWSRKRVDLDYAMNTIGDKPGIKFDDWAAELYPPEVENAETVVAARNRAKVALSKLFVTGRVEKRYDRGGNLLLYRPGDAPKAGALTK